MFRIFAALVLIAFIFCGCFTPSRTAPSVKEYSMQNMGRSFVTSRTVHIPTPLPFKYEFGGAWDIRFNIFDLDREVSAFTVKKDNKIIAIRGARKDYFAQDTTFTSPFDVSDEEFALYYLNWDMDYWKNLIDQTEQEIAKRLLQNDSVLSTIGISTRKTSGESKTSQELFFELSDRFSVTGHGALSPNEKMNVVQSLFGNAGNEMIPILNQGSAALQKRGHMISYTASEATYNAEKKYGTISRSLPDSKTCTLASVQANNYIYMITGTTSSDDSDDMCEVIADIWEDRAEF
ncbi:hypothetical protein [Fibrobacter sp. HC4]|uniref:hypothetical protein n=1 Tax=Fibrobacter sp. HC4 TaxID=3239812 RepID=UPI002018C219|nr:hypothetical protein [Fibrobacter succinogenes]MCL4100769.1 hypothetical protein [Fibrobacter succinogenes]